METRRGVAEMGTAAMETRRGVAEMGTGHRQARDRSLFGENYRK